MPTKEQIVTHQPPMPQKTKDKYGEQIKNLPFDNGTSSLVIEFEDRTKVLEYCKKYFKDRVYVTRKIDIENQPAELRLYRTK